MTSSRLKIKVGYAVVNRLGVSREFLRFIAKRHQYGQNLTCALLFENSLLSYEEINIDLFYVK